ncbi:MAG: Crp/Fnr family transcriptional regulator [Pseudomarimonas sp.]
MLDATTHDANVRSESPRLHDTYAFTGGVRALARRPVVESRFLNTGMPGQSRSIDADDNPLAGEAGVPQTNVLLAALNEADRARIIPHLSLVSLPAGRVICEANCKQEVTYFPISSVISMHCVTAAGATTELAVIGNEGVAGLCMLMGDVNTPHQLVVQASGQAYAIRATALKAEFYQGGNVQQRLLRYMQTLLTQVAQIAVCNRHHSVEQQLCRRLLSALDRSPTSQLPFTHESLANMLGVRREGISIAASKLQRAGVINYRRGQITVLDRRQLERLACECYGVIKSPSHGVVAMRMAG